MEQKPLVPELYLVNHDQGIIQGCKRCRKVLMEGKFAIGLKIEDENGNSVKYLLGVPAMECCGEEKDFIQTYAVEAEAEAELERVRRHLNEGCTTAGLKLLSAQRLGLN